MKLSNEIQTVSYIYVALLRKPSTDWIGKFALKLSVQLVGIKFVLELVLSN